jgi:hypothetical protein
MRRLLVLGPAFQTSRTSYPAQVSFACSHVLHPMGLSSHLIRRFRQVQQLHVAALAQIENAANLELPCVRY